MQRTHILTSRDLITFGIITVAWGIVIGLILTMPKWAIP
jgi:hypothetical protein